MKMSKPHIAILGAGPSGVGAAYRLMKNEKAKITVLEARDRVGGNAGSFERHGIHLDYGSHRLHPACKPDILEEIHSLLGNDLLKRPRHGRIRLNNRWIHFPIQFSDMIRKLPLGFSGGVFSDMVKKSISGKVLRSDRNDNFAAVLRKKLGKTICDEFYFPYAKKIWGLEPDQIASIQAEKRVSADSFTKLIKKVFLKSLSKSGEKVPFFYYPKRGYGQISDAYYHKAEQLGADFRFKSKVIGLHTEGSKIKSVKYEHGGEQKSIEADLIWSTLPITLTAKMMSPEPDSSVINAADRMRFRSMVLIYLFLEQDRFSEYDAHYFPEEKIPITRLSETKNYYSATMPTNLTCICAELPCSVDDEYWTMGQEEAKSVVVESLNRAGLLIGSDVKEIVIRKIKQAYPIYDLGFESHLETLNHYFGTFQNMILFGRQGLFVHDNTHHALHMAYSASECVDSEGKFDHNLWSNYLMEFESHVVED